MRGKLVGVLLPLVLLLAGCANGQVEQNIDVTSASPEKVSTSEQVEQETAEPEPIVRPEWNALDPIQTRKIAFEETMAYMDAVTPVADPINHLFTPNADKQVVEKTSKEMPQIAGLFTEVLTPTGFTVVWTDDADAPNAAEFVCEEIGRCDLDPSRNVCSMGVLPGIVFFCYSTGIDPNHLVSVMSHDYAHFVQYGVSDTRFTPSWFTEGTATYFEKILEAERFSYGVETLDHGLVWGVDILYESQGPLTFSNPPTEEEVLRAMNSSMVFGDLTFESARLGYYLGALTTEVMIAKEGLPTFFEFWRLTGEMEFEEAFQEIYGIPTSEFFDYFAPYAVAKIVSDGKR